MVGRAESRAGDAWRSSPSSSAAWGSEGAQGPNWAGAYGALSDHYPWLAGTRSRRTPDGSYSDVADALGAPATQTGNATLSFGLTVTELPTRSPEDDLTLGIFFVNPDGEVRWAKPVQLS